jgi:hypothetical protein
MAKGEQADYYPMTREVYHLGAGQGEYRHCRDRGYVDLDRAYENSCADICGR